jgi:biotin/methionine sulfoxide reductase
VVLEDFGAPNTLFAAFREAPDKYPLATPSGKIELYSETIAGFAYPSCPGHACWLQPEEWLGAKKQQQFPLHLISNQPKDKLHSQLDFASHSRKAKRKQRVVVSIHPQDAAVRNIEDGAIVRLFNARGACLACADLSADTQQGVLIMPTGAWYAPAGKGKDPALDIHGNPNVLTLDKGCSQLSQGPSAQSCLVEIELFQEDIPDLNIHLPPRIIPAPDGQ